MIRGAIRVACLLAACGSLGCASLRQHYLGSAAPPPFLTEWETRVLPTSGTYAAQRNARLSQGMLQIDTAYEQFRGEYFANRAAIDTVGDLVGLGLNGATVFSGAAAAPALAAAAAAVIGTRSVLDRNLFAETSRVVVLMTMDAARAEARVAIVVGMTQSIEDYPLDLGMLDLVTYYRSGSVLNAMVTIGAGSVERSQRADQMLRGVRQRRTNGGMMR